jgi:hypothetical protein
MRKIMLATTLLLTIASFAQQRLVDFVNPFIGTGGHGHTYPEQQCHLVWYN